ncbi:ATPase, T2SS/T4P/T4SS family [Halobacteriovorax sp. GB3]|uniref:CpaF family protein n=1 Tax=Halobacteriovorax sp. GB3 TaxID=2719615 RepID=UPI00235FE1D4|nr:ATPase, T2SS/T4P/T4SS family [Halobacteriovorax sp. GB3]MDD0853385.1 ATPase, T2SS/T4P/T4SS family [Halobacteriovorax sp. GB3]
MMNEANSVWNMINELSTKKGISEIVINDPKTVFVERGGKFIQLNVQLTKTDMYEFISDVAKFNKRTCDVNHPILDGNLPDGSRINAIIEPFSSGSPAISIRRYLKVAQSFAKNPNAFGLNENWCELMRALVSANMNVIVSGGTGVGKTTFLNMLLGELSVGERVVTIEDTLELSLNRPNVVRLEAASRSTSKADIGIRELVKNTLRMRPDRIIIGEVRGAEIFDLLQAMNTGHDGSMTSVHASSPGECFQRIETLFLMTGFDVPIKVIRKLLVSAVDFVIQISRDRDGNRVISEVRELTGMEGDMITSQVIATFEDGKLSATGLSPQRMEKLARLGGLPLDFFNS